MKYKIYLDDLEGVWDKSYIGEADGENHRDAILKYINSHTSEKEKQFVRWCDQFQSYGMEVNAGFCKIYAVEWSHEHDVMAKEAAYYKWLHAGCPTDRSHQFWVEAERDIIKTLPKLY